MFIIEIRQLKNRMDSEEDELVVMDKSVLKILVERQNVISKHNICRL